jgi:Flp pilus assembly protein TadG
MTRAANEQPDRGSATVELAILTPALLALLGLGVVGGRIQIAGAAVEHAAAAAAREASLTRNPLTARTSATSTAKTSLADQGLSCVHTTVTVDTAGFATRVGQPGQVRATVTCIVGLSDIALPGVPGSRTLTADAASPLDRYRAR